jgi:hypothetical protein
MKGNLFISALKKKLRVTTDRAVANRLGITEQAIHNWKNRRSVTTRQLVGLVQNALVAGADNLQKNAIFPIVEFFPISKCESKQGAKYELFTARLENGNKHPYLLGLQDELKLHHGVYIFFDSRGQAIYAGKARLQNLWKEMNLAFNRERGDVQSVKRVKHPSIKIGYLTSDEKSRQIRDTEVPLHDIATYFSAYRVADILINKIEAMLVRSFANDLLNKKMEQFFPKKKSKKSKK